MRLLAPLALVLVTLAFVAVVLTSRSGDGSGGPAKHASRQTTSATRTAKTARRKPRKATYTVKTGDTLAGIADKTGVSVGRLQELNPALDPQALVSGQTIKLRE
jgi:LysM repeat protein